MIADGEAVALIADELDQMQYWRAAVENDRLFFVAIEVDDLFAFGNRRKRWRSEAGGGEIKRFKRLGGGMKLAEPAIDEHQRRHGMGRSLFAFFILAAVFFEQAAIATRDHFAHGGEIIHTEDGHHLELAISLLVHLAVFPDHQ